MQEVYFEMILLVAMLREATELLGVPLLREAFFVPAVELLTSLEDMLSVAVRPLTSLLEAIASPRVVPQGPSFGGLFLVLVAMFWMTVSKLIVVLAASFQPRDVVSPSLEAGICFLVCQRA